MVVLQKAASAVVAFLTLALAGCGNGGRDVIEFAGATMGTGYSVKVAQPLERAQRDTLLAEIEAELAAVNSAMSTYDPDSELSQFNASTSTEWIEISPMTYEVIDEALRISRMTRGAFDITVGPAVNAWGFGPGEVSARLPEDFDVETARRRVGFALLKLRESPPSLRKARRDVYVDLSAIAKGFAVDRIALLLESHGIERYLVEIGGELRARGASARGDTWRIAVEKPVANERSVQKIVPVADTGMATSGNYRNFFEHSGVRYSHTIDPRTARPVMHKLASVTVLHPSAMTADALATAMSVLGAEQGLALAEARQIAALFIDEVDGMLSERPSSAFLEKVPAT